MKVENNLPVVYLSIVLPIGTLRPFCSSAEVLPLCLCLLGLVDMATGSCGSMCGCTGHGIVTISRDQVVPAWTWWMGSLWLLMESEAAYGGVSELMF